MARRLLPLAVAIALVLGCKKKPPEGGGDGAPSDPNATYTLKIRPAAQGDKSEVSGAETTEVEITGVPGKQTNVKKYEYTEHILEMPAGEKLPTKATRTYKLAQRTSFTSKQLEALPYQGKTVTIEKKGGQYQFSVDGKRLAGIEAVELESEFRNKDKDGGGPDQLLPKQAVKVGDSWALDAAAMKMFGGGMGNDLDPAKSKFTCKLAKMYTKDGKQWGVIEFDLDIVPNSKADGTGSIKIAGKFDAVLDGSARDGTMTANLNGSFSGNQKGKAVGGTLSGNVEKSIKTAQ